MGKAGSGDHDRRDCEVPSGQTVRIAGCGNCVRRGLREIFFAGVRPRFSWVKLSIAIRIAGNISDRVALVIRNADIA